jgi:uncharacterized protein (DUF1786 family)
VRILAIDVGTGTQDILLFDSSQNLENCPKLVMPSATTQIARCIEQATRKREPILLDGVTMGGGPSAWAAEAHLREGLHVYATPDAARTFDDHLENVGAMGVKVVSEDEASSIKGTRITMQDVDLDAIASALEAFGLSGEYDAIAIAVFDHGAAPRDVSDRTFRFEHLRRILVDDPHLASLGLFPEELPPYLTRMQAVAQTVGEAAPRLLLLDTAPAGALGALDDPQVSAGEDRLLVNVGNMHATAFRLNGDGVCGLFEHHTGLVDKEKLERLITRLVDGRIEDREVFDDHGHGAHIFSDTPGTPFLAVTGPRRALLNGSFLDPYLASPHGDMMLAGCYGLIRAFAYKTPEWREEIQQALQA